MHFDRLALQADHVVVVNRVKPHTRFVGPIESGLMKMLLIGLGGGTGPGLPPARSTTTALPRSSGAWWARCLPSATSWPGWRSWRTRDEQLPNRGGAAGDFERREAELLSCWPSDGWRGCRLMKSTCS